MDCLPETTQIGMSSLLVTWSTGAHDKKRDLFINTVQYGVHFSFLRLKATIIKCHPYVSVTKIQAHPTLKGAPELLRPMVCGLCLQIATQTMGEGNSFLREESGIVP